MAVRQADIPFSSGKTELIFSAVILPFLLHAAGNNGILHPKQNGQAI